LQGIKRRLDLLIEVIEGEVPRAVHVPCGGRGCDKCRERGYVTSGEIPQANSDVDTTDNSA
jgi:hypothetical protein